MMDSAGIAELVQIPLNIELELNSGRIDDKQSDMQITNVEYLDLDTREIHSVMDLTALSSEVYEMSDTDDKQSDIQITNVEYLDIDTGEIDSVMDLTALSSEGTNDY